jgi:integrase
MASIHKDPRGKSPFFYCAFTLPNGKRVFRSTKLTDKDAALRFCLTMEDATWKKDAKTHRKTARVLPEDQARKILDEIRTLSGESTIRVCSLSDYAKEWLASKQTTATASTVVRYSGVVNAFVAHVGQRGTSSIETITAGDVKAFRDFQLREGKAQTTANLALKNLRILFNDARREGLISVNPAEGVKIFDVEKEARDVFTHEQLKAIIAAASSEWKTAVLLAYNGGLRLGDAVSLAWENVSFEKHEIRFFPQKTAGRRHPDWKKHLPGQLEIPMMPELEAHLLSLPSSDDPAAPLCPTLSTKSTGGNHGLSTMFQRVMAKAGVHGDRGVEKSGKGRQFKTLGFHSLRHTFVSELANADVPADVRRQISGHSDEKIHERYTHLDIVAKRRALANLRPLAD